MRHTLSPAATLFHADCRDAIKQIPSDSLDSCVTDPPYALVSIVKRFGGPNAAPAKGNDAYMRASAGFMSCSWDTGETAFSVEFWAEVFRVLKPGAFVAAFGASRGYHRMACAVEDAGFEIRDSLMWVYGTGFPKSHDVAKGVDKLDTVGPLRERAYKFTAWMRSTGITSKQINEATGTNMASHYLTDKEQPAVAVRDLFEMMRPHFGCDVPADIEALVDSRTVESENMKRREVIGIENKPKPTFHTADIGGEAVDNERNITRAFSTAAQEWEGWGTALKPAFEPIVLARKPLSEGTVAANVLRWRTGALNIDASRIHTGESTARVYTAKRTAPGATQNATGERHTDEVFEGASKEGRWPANVVTDGSDEVVAAFPNTSGSKRGIKDPNGSMGYHGGASGLPGVVGGYDDPGGSAARFFYSAKASKADRNGSKHPTVKPISLMEWLATLITPPGGTVLDPFAGSGTTGIAATNRGFNVILCEREAEYVADIRARFGTPRSPVVDLAAVRADIEAARAIAALQARLLLSQKVRA